MNKAERLRHDGAEDPVLFYLPRHEFGCFSNFSDHPVVLLDPWTFQPEVYRTSEVRFQAMKATNRADYDRVMQCQSVEPSGASLVSTESKARGRAILLRDDWGSDINTVCWFVMVEVLLAKVLQNPDVMVTLMTTGDRVIYEDSPSDDIWGWRHGQSYVGKNLLGKAWMHIREVCKADYSGEQITARPGWTYVGCPDCGYVTTYLIERLEAEGLPLCVHNGSTVVAATYTPLNEHWARPDGWTVTKRVTAVVES